MPPQSALVNGHGNGEDKSITYDGHFNNNNNDSGDGKNDDDAEALNEIVEPEVSCKYISRL